MAVNKVLLGYSVVILFLGVILLVNSSLGVQCNNECEDYKKAHEASYTWLTINLVVSSIIVLGSLVGLYFSLTGKQEISLTKKPNFANPDLPPTRSVLPPIPRTI